MKFLLVNDDGFGSEGIILLESILKEFGDVFVVAPMEVQSGKACALTYCRPVGIKVYDDHHYALDCTPTYCTSFGLNAIDTDIDIVVSGINDGPNLGIDSMYSGTVGGCIEALFGGKPAIAFSVYDRKDFTMAKLHLKEVLKYILDNHLYDSSYLLNVNFPKGKEYRGVKMTSLHFSPIHYHFEKDGDIVTSSRYGMEDNLDKGSDIYAVLHGYCSITPLGKLTYQEKDLYELKKKAK